MEILLIHWNTVDYEDNSMNNPYKSVEFLDLIFQMKPPPKYINFIHYFLNKVDFRVQLLYGTKFKNYGKIR